jgi:hypothetical protein
MLQQQVIFFKKKTRLSTATAHVVTINIFLFKKTRLSTATAHVVTINNLFLLKNTPEYGNCPC